MNNKFTFIFFRGLGRFLYDFNRNVFTLLTLATLIFVYHIFYTASMGTATFLSHIAKANTVRVYLQVDSKIDIDKTIENYKTIPNVSDAKYYTPAEARAFVIENAPSVIGLQALSDEFFPAYFEIFTDNGTSRKILDEISEKAKIPQAQSVSYGKEYLSMFNKIRYGAGAFIILISALFGLSISFVIFNTVKLTLYRFKEEVRLYGLVGATRPFISVPYIIEAFFNALTAFFVSTVAFAITFSIFNARVLQASEINVFSMPAIIYFIAVFLFMCIMSTLAAAVSVTSFLRRVSSVNED